MLGDSGADAFKTGSALRFFVPDPSTWRRHSDRGNVRLLRLTTRLEPYGATNGRCNVPCQILLVDDDDDLREMMSLLLRQEGFCTQTAVDGREALNLLRSGLRPAVILLDLMMPRMSGVEFRAVQRSDAALAAIPVVAVTAAAPSLIQNVHADVVVRKPFDFDELFSIVRRFC